MIITIKDDDGKTVGSLIANSKVFKTDSKGFFGVGKVEIDGKRYQCQVQMVEIGSKLQSKDE